MGSRLNAAITRCRIVCVSVRNCCNCKRCVLNVVLVGLVVARNAYLPTPTLTLTPTTPAAHPHTVDERIRTAYDSGCASIRILGQLNKQTTPRISFQAKIRRDRSSRTCDLDRPTAFRDDPRPASCRSTCYRQTDGSGHSQAFAYYLV